MGALRAALPRLRGRGRRAGMGPAADRRAARPGAGVRADPAGPDARGTGTGRVRGEVLRLRGGP
ncbi:hypothetical protein ACFFX0_09950 [Citricoccus parietis]|uniref:Uncharacterized protein n=1 Tax=Citricoccus parietis TaxID=592307 RepID=A0ABV5FXV2_9MICC